MNEKKLSDQEFRVLLNLFMISDPWQLDNDGEDTIRSLLQKESKLRDFEDWIHSFHEFEVDG